MTEEIVKKPFHKAIACRIREEITNFDALRTLAEMVSVTKIPDGHTAIADALETKFDDMVIYYRTIIIGGVVSSLRKEAEIAKQEEKQRDQETE